MGIQASVGRNGFNFPIDVQTVQALLQQNLKWLGPVVPIKSTGLCDAQTIYLIESFQKRVLNIPDPTGRVDPDSQTWFGLNGRSEPSTTPTDSVLAEALQQMRDAFVNFGVRFIKDAGVRADYVAKASRYSDDILERVNRGELTAREGAVEAQAMRNGLMDAGRLQSSAIGRAAAELEKATGKTMDELLSKYSRQLFARDFAELSTNEQDVVFISIVKAAGRPNPRFTAVSEGLGTAGKGLLIISIAFSVYAIVESERPVREAVKQTASIGTGFLGSLAGGAAAGMVCGPGAPICAGVGVFVGGLVFALSADLAFDEIWD
jgi:hypothetical protein